MRKGILFIFIWSVLHLSASAQDPEHILDSLNAELSKAKEDTNKFNILSEMSNICFQANPAEGVKYGQQALQLARDIKFAPGEMRGNNLIARCYAVQNKLPEALKHFQAALVEARKLKRPINEAKTLTSISAVYTQNGDFDKALEHAMQAKTAYEKAGVKYMVNLMTNIGLLYSRQDKPKEALVYYFEGVKQQEAYGDKNNYGEFGNLYLNIGSNYVRMNDFPNALQYFFKAMPILKEIGHTKNLAICLDDIGGVYLELIKNKDRLHYPDSLNDMNANLAKSEYYMQLALPLAEQLNLMDIREDVYSTLAQLYAKKQDYKSAYNYYMKKIDVRDSMRNITKEKEFAKVEAEFAVRKQTDSLNFQNALKDKEIREKNLERNGAIALISLAGIIGLLIINRQKLKHQQRSRIAEAETKRVSELAKQQLDDFTKSIQEKNELIEKFSAEIEKYQALPCSNDLPDKENSLQLLQNSVILTEDQWVSFQYLFDKVHTGYINRVKDKFADLTAAELRFAILTKMGLKNKEMAAMLGVSAEAVRVSKHRLLKKIQLPEGISLDEVVQSL